MKEEDYMKMAISLARRGIGTTSPNPMVGAVLVKGTHVVGKGYHKKPGLPHAEIMAIDDAKENASGSTLYVNLEPCVHFGRTPPCVDAIKKAGIKKVVASMLDPNPDMNGKGIEALKKANINVKVGLLEEESRKLNEAFIVYMEKKRPFFVMKAAASLDGKIATKTCDSKWISNEESRNYANRLRSTMDGVMVGINTVIADNPLLVPRMLRPKKYPVRIVLDSKLRIPLASDMVKTSKKYRTLIFALEGVRSDKEDRLKSLGVEIIKVPREESGRIPIKYVCEELYSKGIISVLVEGGGETNSTLLKEGVLDKVILFYAPIFIGGKNALNVIGGRGIDFIKDAYKIDISLIKRFKEDICVEGYVHRNY